MDLWIRSQDKENLQKAGHLGVYNEKIYVNGYEENGYCIGTYKTKERALEVLNEIQNILNTYNRVNGKNGNYEDLDLTVKVNMLNYVYEMPEE